MQMKIYRDLLVKFEKKHEEKLAELIQQEEEMKERL